MKYEDVWNAVDKLAQIRGLSPSGLAKLAGLDATTFNKSKRTRPDGKKRWPSLDSINKVLEVCNISFEQFYNLIDGAVSGEVNTIPFIKFSKLQTSYHIENKLLKTHEWNKVMFPDTKDATYAIEIDNNTYHPVYRNGSMLVLTGNSDIRKGDRIVVFTDDKKLIIGEFVRRAPSTLVISNIISSKEEYTINISSIKLINRILWASQ